MLIETDDPAAATGCVGGGAAGFRLSQEAFISSIFKWAMNLSRI